MVRTFIKFGICILVVSIVLIVNFNFFYIDNFDKQIYVSTYAIGLFLVIFIPILVGNSTHQYTNIDFQLLKKHFIVTVILVIAYLSFFKLETFTLHDADVDKLYIKGILLNSNVDKKVNDSHENLFLKYSSGDPTKISDTWNGTSILFNKIVLLILLLGFLVFLCLCFSVAFELLFFPILKILNRNKMVYFSYAWKDSTNVDREKFIEELYNNLKDDKTFKYNAIRDKNDLNYRGSISAFMKLIGRGDVVVVAISDKYLKSDYCMTELHELYLNSQSNKEELMKKVFPVRVEQIDLNSPSILNGYFNYWEEKEKEWEVLIKTRGSRISAEQQEDYNNIKKICIDLGRFLKILADMNSLSKELLQRDDFALIKKSIQDRMKETNGV